MAIITVEVVGKKCTGGHYEIIIKSDGVEMSRIIKHESEILDGFTSCKSMKEAAVRIMESTKAPNMAAWSALVKTKSIEVPDETHINGFVAIQKVEK